MFKNNEIKDKQKYSICNNEELRFEPDSSPEAWKHYKDYYSVIFKNYNFDNLFFYNYYKDVKLNSGFYNGDKWLNFTDLPLRNGEYNRLFALEKDTIRKKENGVEYCEPANRLGGECDFNFNDSKSALFKKIIGNNDDALGKLEKCKANHHNLINFSLIQGMGNMQGFKGNNIFDRFDTFIFKLDQYFSGLSGEILSSSSDNNKSSLKKYLNNFKDVYEYFKEIYFIDDQAFINNIIEQGALPIKKCEDVVRYMNLAEDFWCKKEFYFLKKEFRTVEDYFNDGNEIYTTNELLVKIENDLGCGEDEGKNLIKRCIERGYIIECSNGVIQGNQKT